jgi:hypothetical protein
MCIARCSLLRLVRGRVDCGRASRCGESRSGQRVHDLVRVVEQQTARGLVA